MEHARPKGLPAGDKTRAGCIKGGGRDAGVKKRLRHAKGWQRGRGQGRSLPFTHPLSLPLEVGEAYERGAGTPRRERKA